MDVHDAGFEPRRQYALTLLGLKAPPPFGCPENTPEAINWSRTLFYRHDTVR